MRFRKYQGLGNDYLILESVELARPLSPALVRLLCDRHFGPGGDGVLVSEQAAGDGFGLRIFNPDGSEAEKSGNGLRIYARFLYDEARVAEAPFQVRTAGGEVTCRVLDAGARIAVEMGTLHFASDEIPVAGPRREVLRERIAVGDEEIEISAVGIGNPHCVVLAEQATPALARRLGPLLESHPLFPNRTNVQIAEVVGPDEIRIEIWERGAGPTLASGSSACAAAAVCRRLGLCESRLTVRMAGGALEVVLDERPSATQIGPARKVLVGRLAEELLGAAG